MNKTKAKKERLIGIDFARAFCAVGIIAYHFYCHSNSEVKIIYESANMAWGGMLVAVFFMISGAMLYYNYSEIPSLKVFYYKRLKTLLPAFYIAYIYYYLETVYATGSVFFGGAKWKSILTVLGMDGYFLYKGGNYYLIGEWFLGAIIILYLLYPLIAWGLKKNVIVTTGVMLGLYAFMCLTDIFEILPDCNVISCTMSMYMGILAIKYRKKVLDNKWLLIPSAIGGIILYCYRVPDMCNFRNIATHVLGFFVFIMLYHIGSVLMKLSFMAKLISIMGALSYPVFLLQHRVILKVLGAYNPVSTLKSLAVLFVIVVLTFIYAKVLQVVTDAVLKSNVYMKFEKKILGNAKKN